MEKYRINALAKDFEIKSKDIIKILNNNGRPGRSHMTALEEEELSIVFEVMTQNNQVDITAFFNVYEEKKAAKKAAELEKKKAEAEEIRKKHGISAAPAQVKKKQKQQPQKQRARGEVRVVDTRGNAGVDLSKYDEKLEKFEAVIPESAQTSKQKIKKKKNRDFGGEKIKGGPRGKFAPQQKPIFKPKPVQLRISVPDEITVGELASRMKTQAGEVIKKLMSMGVMASVNEVIDYDTAYLVADEFKIKVSKEVVVTIEEKLFKEDEDKAEDLIPRAPVVVVMGHVDHGKTSLLDAIRQTHVTSGEAGGITQHIGAYRVNIGDEKDKKEITFLDTPGHAAFTEMRARGANITDIAVLVVSADDGVMPQTVEAINHAKAADTPIIVAINKMDRTGADPEKVKQELTKYDLVPEEWGGDTICVPVSALKRTGIDQLLEMILLSAEMLELKANPSRSAKGVVIEAKLDKGRGPVGTVLVQNGTLREGDYIIAGTTVGRVRVMTNDKGDKVNEAGPSFPVEIMGLSEVPNAGDIFNVVADERMAKELVDQRKHKEKQEQFKAESKVSLDDLFDQIGAGVKTLNIIVKADVQGSAEAVTNNLQKLSNDEVKVNVIHSGAGAITESDVMLASASNAIIIGFNIRPDKQVSDLAERDNVDIHTYRIIYECITEVESAMKGMLAPTYKEVTIGHAEVRQTIHVPNVGTIAGCYILDGKVTRNANIRVLRDSVVIFEDKISSLKRFKDDVREVLQSFECGIGLEKFNDIKVGDVLEAFVLEEIKR
ncbi:MAG: translation initiation factor IF-2 [Eubacteriales bacterium]|nr:translation initiation factor IF-2 [Eubacteriales bacterium]